MSNDDLYDYEPLVEAFMDQLMDPTLTMEEFKTELSGRKKYAHTITIAMANDANVLMQKIAKEKGVIFPWQIIPLKVNKGQMFGGGKLGDEFALAPINDHIMPKIINGLVDYGIFLKERHDEEAKAHDAKGIQHPQKWKVEFLTWAERQGKIKKSAYQEKLRGRNTEKDTVRNIGEKGSYNVSQNIPFIIPFAYLETEYNKLLKSKGRGGIFNSTRELKEALEPRVIAEAKARLTITSDDDARKIIVNAPEFLSGSRINYLAGSKEDQDVINEILQIGAERFWTNLDDNFDPKLFAKNSSVSLTGLFPEDVGEELYNQILSKATSQEAKLYGEKGYAKKTKRGVLGKFPNIDNIRNWFHEQKDGASPKQRGIENYNSGKKAPAAFESLTSDQKWRELERMVFMIANSIYEKNTGKSKRLRKGRNKSRRTDITSSASYQAHKRDHDKQFLKKERDDARDARRTRQSDSGDKRYGRRSRRWKRES